MVDCRQCRRDRTVTLAGGDQCCTWCERHRAECEARAVLAMPTKLARQAYLVAIGEKRGPDAEKKLRGDVLTMWNLQRKEL